MRKLVVRSNPTKRRKRRVTQARKRSTTSMRRTIRARRSPSMAAPRRRRRTARKSAAGMDWTVLLGAGVAGGAAGYAIDTGVDHIDAIASKFTDPATYAVVKTAITAGVAVAAVSMTKKQPKKTRDFIQMAAIGATGYSAASAAKAIYTKSQTTPPVVDTGTGTGTDTGTDTSGVSAYLPRGAHVAPVVGIGAAARLGAPARRGMGYVSPAYPTGTVGALMPTSLDNITNGVI